ncbi:MAG: ABC transporter substrate-binding protein [Methylomagnum sp.]
MRLYVLAVLLALSSLLAGPCLASESVVLQLKWRHAYQFAGYYMAQERGYYQEAGLAVEIREGRPGIDFVDEVVSERAHYGTGSSGVVLDRNQGRPLVVLAVIFQHSPDVLMVSAKSGITSPQQLVFKTVMLSDSTPAIAAMLLNEVGSLHKFTLLDQANDLQGLIDGRLDAVAGYDTDQPFFFQEKKSPITLLRPIHYGVDFYGDNLFTSERELREHPERVKAFREASLKGWEYAMGHPVETIAVVQKYGAPGSAAHLRYEYEAMRELLLPELIEMGHTNPGRWRHIADTYVRLGLLRPDYSLSGFLYDPNPVAGHDKLRKYALLALGVASLAVVVILGLLAFNRRLQREVKVRQQAEAALQERETRLRTIIDNEPECIKLLDREGRLLDINPAGLAMVEADSLAQVRGQRVCAMVEGRDRAAFQDMVEAVFRGETRQMTFGAVGLKGGRRLLESIAVPLRELSGGGAVYALLGVTRDVTERRRIESELDRYRHHLEELVDERTRQLIETNRALEATRDQAEAANRAKSVFLANMSHEIRSPMNAIVGFTHLLRRQVGDPQQLDYLRKVSDSTTHLLAIVNDILDIAKIEAGKLVLNDGEFGLASLFNDVQSLVSEQAERKRLILVTEIDPGLTGMFRGDALRLGQVLLNFAGNAVKFTPQGSIAMRAKRIEGTGQDALLRFEVEDTGVGIAPEDQARLFEAFEQVDGSTTRQYGGTGLGLTISRRLVELMGGAIGVDSQPGQGSVFWFTIRLATCAQASVTRPAPVMSRGSEPLPVSEAERTLARRHPGARLLLAEDNPINREVALDLLRDARLDIDVAENGAEAVERARQAQYDLILMDMQMPVLDGLAATRAIRALPGYQATPILAMTANVFEEDRRRCLESGMDDHIGKPVDPERLFGALLKWLPARPEAMPTEPQAEMPDTVSRPVWPEWLDKIPGLEPAQGLKCLNGKLESYLRLLRRFADTHRGDMAELRKHLDADDLNHARRLAHSLKGVAGSLGAARVQSLASELEALLRERGDRRRVTALASALEIELNSLMAAILAQPEEEVPVDRPVASEHPPFEEIVARLDVLLGQCDLEAATVFRESAPYLRAELGERAADIGRLIDEFEYERALELLRKGGGRLGGLAPGDGVGHEYLPDLQN